MVAGVAEAIRALDATLRVLADETGEAAFLRAANALHQQSSGRPAINDRRLIEEARWLLREGKAKSINQALLKVARTVADEDGVKAVAERLRRKMRADSENRSTN